MDPDRARAFEQLPVDVFFEIIAYLDQNSFLYLMTASKRISRILTSSELITSGWTLTRCAPMLLSTCRTSTSIELALTGRPPTSSATNAGWGASGVMPRECFRPKSWAIAGRRRFAGARSACAAYFYAARRLIRSPSQS